MDDEDGTPPGPGLYVPDMAYGRLWRDRQRRSALGHALEVQPLEIQAIVQTFPGGILIGNRSDGSTYVLLRSKLRF
jgi:hypothetical protein